MVLAKRQGISAKRRGMAENFIVMIILGFVGLIILLLVVVKLQDAAQAGYPKSVCKTSVVANSVVRVPGTDSQMFNLECPTRYVTIDVSEAREKTMDSKVIKRDIMCGKLKDEKQKACWVNATNAIIGSLLYDCWDQFAAGQVRVFSSYKTDRQCLVCSRVEFSPEAQAAMGLGSDYVLSHYPDDLNEYLKTHTPDITEEYASRITYYEFLQDKLDAFKGGGDSYLYRLDRSYAIVFGAVNENQLKVIAEGIGKTAEDVLEFWKDNDADDEQEEHFVNTLDLIEYDQVGSVCQVLA